MVTYYELYSDETYITTQSRDYILFGALIWMPYRLLCTGMACG
jgi:hypothetical protein